mmetsp:Transcript_45180/g.110026  ORF Transcript_45180/g.110026 Transcript_45180/m.110026 type:complete len:115 (-) Transcript_45180:2378-2722(-)
MDNYRAVLSNCIVDLVSRPHVRKEVMDGPDGVDDDDRGIVFVSAVVDDDDRVQIQHLLWHVQTLQGDFAVVQGAVCHIPDYASQHVGSPAPNPSHQTCVLLLRVGTVQLGLCYR